MMRQFYKSFPIRHAVRDEFNDHLKSTAVRYQLGTKPTNSPVSDTQEPELRNEFSWTHYRLLFKVKNEKARFWYMNKAADNGWGTRILERQINSFYYERLLKSRNKNPLNKEMNIIREREIKYGA